VKQWLSVWAIQNSAVVALQDAESNVEDHLKPVDAGGPKEQLAEDIWRKLIGLKVLSSDGKKSVPLSKKSNMELCLWQTNVSKDFLGKTTMSFLGMSQSEQSSSAVPLDGFPLVASVANALLATDFCPSCCGMSPCETVSLQTLVILRLPSE
jgi:hypothetical protein